MLGYSRKKRRRTVIDPCLGLWIDVEASETSESIQNTSAPVSDEQHAVQPETSDRSNQVSSSPLPSKPAKSARISRRVVVSDDDEPTVVTVESFLQQQTADCAVTTTRKKKKHIPVISLLSPAEKVTQTPIPIVGGDSIREGSSTEKKRKHRPPIDIVIPRSKESSKTVSNSHTHPKSPTMTPLVLEPVYFGNPDRISRCRLRPKIPAAPVCPDAENQIKPVKGLKTFPTPAFVTPVRKQNAQGALSTKTPSLIRTPVATWMDSTQTPMGKSHSDLELDRSHKTPLMAPRIYPPNTQATSQGLDFVPFSQTSPSQIIRSTGTSLRESKYSNNSILVPSTQLPEFTRRLPKAQFSSPSEVHSLSLQVLYSGNDIKPQREKLHTTETINNHSKFSDASFGSSRSRHLDTSISHVDMENPFAEMSEEQNNYYSGNDYCRPSADAVVPSSNKNNLATNNTCIEKGASSNALYSSLIHRPPSPSQSGLPLQSMTDLCSTILLNTARNVAASQEQKHGIRRRPKLRDTTLQQYFSSSEGMQRNKTFAQNQNQVDEPTLRSEEKFDNILTPSTPDSLVPSNSSPIPKTGDSQLTPFLPTSPVAEKSSEEPRSILQQLLATDSAVVLIESSP